MTRWGLLSHLSIASALILVEAHCPPQRVGFYNRIESSLANRKQQRLWLKKASLSGCQQQNQKADLIQESTTQEQWKLALKWNQI